MKRPDPSRTAILLIDVQDKLVAAMPAEQMRELERAARILCSAAAELGIKVLCTEQYPKGLGPTIASFRPLLEATGAVPIEKLSFSACGEAAFARAFDELALDAVVCLGMETHVCVFQTVRDLAARGLAVHVPIDGVASRRDDHRQTGLALCERAGAIRTTAETLLFDWLVAAGSDAFKKLSKLVR